MAKCSQKNSMAKFGLWLNGIACGCWGHGYCQKVHGYSMANSHGISVPIVSYYWFPL